MIPLVEGFDNPNKKFSLDELNALIAEVNRLGGGTRYHKVGPDKTILGPDGRRFVVKGVCMFDYLFASFEPRTNWAYRKIFEPLGTGPASGVSEPTYYGRVVWVDEDNVAAQIARFRGMGGNLIRVMLEPAMLNAASYVDPVNGLVYPSELEMLDTIIEQASIQGVVVYLTLANEQQFSATGVASPTVIAFWEEIIERYANFTNIWICPSNEMNSTEMQSSGGGWSANPNLLDPTTWITKADDYVTAIRAAGFEGPIGLNPPEWGYSFDLIAADVLVNATLRDDPNLFYDAHQYALDDGDSKTFYKDDLTSTLSNWASYVGTHCFIVGEHGINNNLGATLDPDLNGGGVSSDAALWAKLQAWSKEFLAYLFHFSEDKLSGAIGHIWQGYIPGLLAYDNNTMILNDGTLTAWGVIFRDYFLARTANIFRPVTVTPTPAAGSFTASSVTAKARQVGKNVDIEVFWHPSNLGTASGNVTMTPPIPHTGEGMVVGGDIIGSLTARWQLRGSGNPSIVLVDSNVSPTTVGNSHAYVWSGRYQAA